MNLTPVHDDWSIAKNRSNTVQPIFSEPIDHDGPSMMRLPIPLTEINADTLISETVFKDGEPAIQLTCKVRNHRYSCILTDASFDSDIIPVEHLGKILIKAAEASTIDASLTVGLKVYIRTSKENKESLSFSIDIGQQSLFSKTKKESKHVVLHKIEEGDLEFNLTELREQLDDLRAQNAAQDELISDLLDDNKELCDKLHDYKLTFEKYSLTLWNAAAEYIDISFTYYQNHTDYNCMLTLNGTTFCTFRLEDNQQIKKYGIQCSEKQDETYIHEYLKACCPTYLEQIAKPIVTQDHINEVVYNSASTMLKGNTATNLLNLIKFLLGRYHIQTVFNASIRFNNVAHIRKCVIAINCFATKRSTQLAQYKPSKQGFLVESNLADVYKIVESERLNKKPLKIHCYSFGVPGNTFAVVERCE